MSFPALVLRNKADRRIKGGALWIYSNEVDTQKTPLKSFVAGDQVEVFNHGGKSLGLAYMNPHSLICGRLFSRDNEYPLNKSLIVHRLKVALALRDTLFDKPFYRLIYGDSDGLPGVVVDRFGDYLVVQIATAGMERVKDELVVALEQVLKPKAIMFKNNSAVREGEGLESYTQEALGEFPDRVLLEENGVAFEAPVLEGQKTGWFYDHRMGRSRMQSYVKGKRVLDLFSYVGAWGVQAAVAGAESVTCVDSSQFALDVAQDNANRNSVENFTTLKGDVFSVLKDLIDARERFDMVIVDPPAFIKRKKDFNKGFEGYRRLNQLAMRLISKDGFLVSASCSMHLTRENLLDVVRGAGRQVDRWVQVLESNGQGPDHPVHPAIPETEYLKTVFARVTRN